MPTFFKYSFNANKCIDFAIYGLLVLSSWAIISIGLEIVPLIENPLFNDDFWLKINNVSLNLAYSYFAGFIIFTLTVTIPQYRRRSINIPLVNKYIQTYFISTTYEFFMFCIENPTLIFDETDKKFMNNFRANLNKQISDNVLNNLLKNRDNNDRYISLTRLVESNSKFINTIIPYEIYLSSTQLVIINEIRKNEISLSVEAYKDFIGVEDIDNLTFKVLKAHVKRVENLNNTIKNV